MTDVGVDGLITFFYYDNLQEAVRFYTEVMGFDLVIDQVWSKIFKVAEKAHVGLVDGRKGYHRPSSVKPVMLTVLVPDVDAWYGRLKRLGVKTLSEPKDSEELNLRMFLLEDPEGYVIEIQKFR